MTNPQSPLRAAELIIVGSANVDLVVQVERHPRQGETVLGGDTSVFPGGKGANTAVAGAKLGTRTSLLGAVGADAHGELLLTTLADAGVDTTLVSRVDAPSGAAYITVSENGENSIVVSPGANFRVGVADIDRAREAIAAARVLFAVLEVPLPTVREAAACAARAGVRVVLNASPVAPLDDETLAVLDPLIVNQHEARVLLDKADGEADGEVLARGLLALGPRSVVVTLGAAGAVVADAAGAVTLPAPEVDVVDTTGAGDSFAGSLAARLAAGWSLADAARDAVSIAADAVTRRGAQG